MAHWEIELRGPRRSLEALAADFDEGEVRIVQRGETFILLSDRFDPLADAADCEACERKPREQCTNCSAFGVRLYRAAKGEESRHSDGGIGNE